MIPKYDVKYNFVRAVLLILVAIIFGFTAKILLGFGTTGLIIGSGIGAGIIHFHFYFKDKKWN